MADKKIIVETKPIKDGTRKVGTNVDAIVKKAVENVGKRIEKAITASLKAKASTPQGRQQSIFKIDPASIKLIAQAVAQKTVADKGVDLRKLDNKGVERLLKEVVRELKSPKDAARKASITKVEAAKFDSAQLKGVLIASVTSALKSEITTVVKEMQRVATKIEKATHAMLGLASKPGAKAGPAKVNKEVKELTAFIKSLNTQLNKLSKSVATLSKAGATTETNKDLSKLAGSIESLRKDFKTMADSIVKAVSPKGPGGATEEAKLLKEVVAELKAERTENKELIKRLDTLIAQGKQASKAPPSYQRGPVSQVPQSTRVTPSDSARRIRANLQSSNAPVASYTKGTVTPIKPGDTKNAKRAIDDNIAGLQESLHELQTYMAGTIKKGLKEANKGWEIIQPDEKDILSAFTPSISQKQLVLKVADIKGLKKKTGVGGLDNSKLVEVYKSQIEDMIRADHKTMDQMSESIGKWIKTAPKYTKGAFKYGDIQKKFRAPEVSKEMVTEIKKAVGGTKAALSKVFEETFLAAKSAMELEMSKMIKSIAIPTIKTDESKNPFIETKLGSRRAVPKFATYTSGFEGHAKARGISYTKEQAEDVRGFGLRPTGQKLIAARAHSRKLVQRDFESGPKTREGVISKFAGAAAKSKAAELARIGVIEKSTKAMANFESEVAAVAAKFKGTTDSFTTFADAMEKVGVTAYDVVKTFENISSSNIYDKMLTVFKTSGVLKDVTARPSYDKPYRSIDKAVAQVEQFAPVVQGGRPRRGGQQSGVVHLTSMASDIYKEAKLTQELHKETIRDLNRRISEITREADILRSFSSGVAAKAPAGLSNLSSLGLPEHQASVMIAPAHTGKVQGDMKLFAEGVDKLKGMTGFTIKMQAEDLTSLAPFRQFQHPGRNISNVGNAMGGLTDRGLARSFGMLNSMLPELPTLRSEKEGSQIKAGKFGKGFGYNVIAELRNTAGTFEDQILVSGKLAKALTAVTKQIVVPASAGLGGKGSDVLAPGVLESRISKAIAPFANKIGAEGYDYKAGADKALLLDVRQAVTTHQGKNIEVQSAKVAEIFLNHFGRKLTTRFGSKGVSVTPTGDNTLASLLKQFGDTSSFKVEEAGLGAAKIPKTVGTLIAEMLTSSKADKDLSDALKLSGNKFILDMFKDASASGITIPEEAFKEQKLYAAASKRLDELYGVKLESGAAGIKSVKGLYGKERPGASLTELKPIDVRISSHGAAKRGLQPELLEIIMGNITGGASQTTLKTDIPKYQSLLKGPGGGPGRLSKTSSALGFKGTTDIDALTKWAKQVADGNAEYAQRLIDLEKNSNYYVSIIDELGKERQSIVGPKFVQIIEEPGAQKAWSPGEISSREKGLKLNLVGFAAYETIFGKDSEFMKSLNTDIYASNKEQWEYVKALQATMGENNMAVQDFMSNLPTLDLAQLAKQPERVGSFASGATTSLRDTVSDIEQFSKAYKVAIPKLGGGSEELYIPGPSIRQATPDTLEGGAYGMSTIARSLQNVIDAAKDAQSIKDKGLDLETFKKAYISKLFDQKRTPWDDAGKAFTKRGLDLFDKGGTGFIGKSGQTKGVVKTGVLKLDEKSFSRELTTQADPALEQEELNFRLKRLEDEKYKYYEDLAKSVLGKKGAVHKSIFTKKIPSIMAKAITAVVDRTTELEGFKEALATIMGGGSSDLLTEVELKELSDVYSEIDKIKTEHASNVDRYRKLKLPVLKQHEIGISESAAAKLPGYSKEEPYVESVRFPFTGTSSVQPYKAKVLEGDQYENVFAVPGVPEMDTESFGKQIKAVQSIRDRAMGARETARTDAPDKVAELTALIGKLNRAIADVIPRYIAHQQKLDFDGDSIQIHSAATREARDNIKQHFDLLSGDISTTAAVFRDKFTSDALQKSTGQFAVAEMAASFNKKFPVEKGFKFLESPALTPGLEYLGGKEKLGILSSKYQTEDPSNFMANMMSDITAEIDNPKYKEEVAKLTSTYSQQGTTVEALDMAINGVDGGLQKLIRGFISAELYAAKFGDAVEAQLFKIHTGSETEGMTRMQRVLESRLGTGQGMIGKKSDFASERTTQINELLRFAIQKGMDVKHAGGPTVAGEIIDTLSMMGDKPIGSSESALGKLMEQITSRSGSYGDLDDFRQANEDALRNTFGAMTMAEVKDHLVRAFEGSNKLRADGSQRDVSSITNESSRTALIDKAVEVLGFKGFMEDLQIALTAEMTAVGSETLYGVQAAKNPIYQLRTSSASIEDLSKVDKGIAPGTTAYRKQALPQVVDVLEQALAQSFADISDPDKIQGAYLKSVSGSLATTSARGKLLSDFSGDVGAGYKPTPGASAFDLAAKAFSKDLPDAIKDLMMSSKDLRKLSDAAGIPSTLDYRKEELLQDTPAALAQQAKVVLADKLGKLEEGTDDYNRVMQEFISEWETRILALNQIDKVLDTIRTSGTDDFIATLGASGRTTTPSEPKFKDTRAGYEKFAHLDRNYPVDDMLPRQGDMPVDFDKFKAPPAGVGAGIPTTGAIIDVRLVDITANVLSMLGTGIAKSQPSLANQMASDPNHDAWIGATEEMRKAAEAKRSAYGPAPRTGGMGLDMSKIGGPALAEQRARAEAVGKYDYLERVPELSKETGALGVYENIKALHEQARDFQAKARGISFSTESPKMNSEIKKSIEEARSTGPDYKEFINLIDELKAAATIEGSDAYKAFKLYKLAVGDFYLAKAEEARQLIESSDTQSGKQEAFTNFTTYIEKLQKSIREGLGKQSDVYTSDKRYISPNLARGSGVYMSPGQIAQKASAPLETDRLREVYNKIIGDTGGGERMRAPIEKAREAVKDLTQADDEMIKLIENGHLMERMGSDIKEAWDFQALTDNISRLREALELYKKYSVNEDSMAAESKNIDSVVKYLKNVEDIYTKIDTSKAVTQGPGKWGETGTIQVPKWLDPEQQLALHQRNIQKLKEYYAKSATEGGAKIGERISYKAQVTGTGGEQLSNKVTDFHKYAESLDNAGDAIGRFTSKERDLTGIMQGTTRGFGAAIERALKWGAASSIVYGGFSQLKAAVGSMSEIETSLAQLRMVMNPLGADFDALGMAAVDFAKTYGVGINDTLQSMKVFAQQGLKQAEIIDRTNTATLASNVTTLGASEATEALTAAMKVFGTEADSSMRYLDAWSEVEARHAITAGDMANAIKKAAAAAANAGVTFDQLNGIVAAVGSVTRQTGKEVGTSMRFIFRRLSSDKGPKELAKLSIPTLTGEGELRGGFDTLNDLAMSWKDLTSAQKMNIAQAIGGTRQYNSLLVLMDNWDEALQAVKDSTNSKGSAERKNAEIMKTYAKQLEQTKAAAVELQMAFGKVVLPGFKAGLKVTKTLLETINAIPGPIKAMAAGSVLFLTYLSKGADMIDLIKGGLGGVGNIATDVFKSLKDEVNMAQFELFGDKFASKLGKVSPLVSAGLSTLGKPVMKQTGTDAEGKPIYEAQKQTLHEFQSSLGKTVYLIKEMGMTYNSVIGDMATTTGGFVEKFGEKMSNYSAALGYGAGALHKKPEGKRSFDEASARAAHLGLSGKAVAQTLSKEGFKGLGKALGSAATLGGEMAALGGLAAGIVIDKFGEKLGAGGKKVAEDWASSNAGLAASIGPLAATTLVLAPALKSVYEHYIGLSRTAKDYKEALYGVRRTQGEELAAVRSLIGEYGMLQAKMEDIAKASAPGAKARRQELGTYESPILSTAKIYEGAKGTANQLAESNTNLVVGYDALGNAILRTSGNFEHFMNVVEKSKIKEMARTEVGVAAKYIEELTTTDGPEAWKYGIKQFVKEVPVIGEMLSKQINIGPAKMLKVMTDNLNKALSARSKNPMATAIDKDIKDYQDQLVKVREGFQTSYSDFRKSLSDISTKGLNANEISNIFSAPELQKGWELMLEVEPTLNTNALRGKTKWQDLLGSEVLKRTTGAANLGFNAQLTKAQLETAGGTSRKGAVRSNDIVTFLAGTTDQYNIAGDQAIVKLKETTDGVFEWVAQYFNTKTLKIEERAFDSDLQNIVDGIFPQKAIQEDISERIEALNEFVAGAGAGLRGIDKRTFKKDFNLGERFYSDIATTTLLQGDKGYTPGGGFGQVDFQSDWAESFKQFYAKPMEEYKNKLADLDKLRLAGLDGEKTNLATGIYEDLTKLQEVLKNNQIVLQYRAVLVDLTKTFEAGARAMQESLAVEKSRMEIFQGTGLLGGVPEGLDISGIKGYSRADLSASDRVLSKNPAALDLAKRLKELELSKAGTAEQVYGADKALIALQSIQGVSKGFGASLSPEDLKNYTETVARTGDQGIAELKIDTNRTAANTAATVERLDAILANTSGIAEIESLSTKFDSAGMSPEGIENTLEKVARVREKAIGSGDTNTAVAANELLDKLSQQLAAMVGVEKSIKMVEGNMTLFSKQYTGQEQAQRAFGGLSSKQLTGELRDVLPTQRTFFGSTVEGQPKFEQSIDELTRLQEKNNEDTFISSKNAIKTASALSVLSAFQTRSASKEVAAYDTKIADKTKELDAAKAGDEKSSIDKLTEELKALTQLRDKSQGKADLTSTVRNMSMLTSGSMQFARALGFTENQIKGLGVGAVGLYGSVKIATKLLGQDLPASAKAFEGALRDAAAAVAKGEKPSISTLYKARKAGQQMEDEFATGGHVKGPGNGTSDDIMAKLSNGEYVIKAASVSKIGRDALDYINSTGNIPKMATGGIVQDPNRKDIFGQLAEKYNLPLPTKGGDVNKINILEELLKKHNLPTGTIEMATGGIIQDPKIKNIFAQLAEKYNIPLPTKGGPKDDNILAQVSNGEYIINASSAGRLGKSRLEYMNSKGKLPRFAEGGAVGSIKEALVQQKVTDSVKLDDGSINRLGQVMAAALASTFSGYIADQTTENTKIVTASAKAADEAEKLTKIIKNNPEASQKVFEKYFSPTAQQNKLNNTVATTEESLVLNSEEEFRKVSKNIEKMRKEMIEATKEMSDEAEKMREELAKLRLGEEIKMQIETIAKAVRAFKVQQDIEAQSTALPQQGGLSKLLIGTLKKYDMALSTSGLMAGIASSSTDRTVQNRNRWDLTPDQLLRYENPNVNYLPTRPLEDISGKFRAAQDAGDLKLKRDPLFNIPYAIEGSILKGFKSFFGTQTRTSSARSQISGFDTAEVRKNQILTVMENLRLSQIEKEALGEDSSQEAEAYNKLKDQLKDVNLEMGRFLQNLSKIDMSYATYATNLDSVSNMFKELASQDISRYATTQSLYGPQGAAGAVTGLEFAKVASQLSNEERVWAGADEGDRKIIIGFQKSQTVMNNLFDRLGAEQQKLVGIQGTLRDPKSSPGMVEAAKKEKAVIEDTISSYNAQIEVIKKVNIVVNQNLMAFYSLSDTMNNLKDTLNEFRIQDTLSGMKAYNNLLDKQKELIGGGSFKSPSATTYEEELEAQLLGLPIGEFATDKERKRISATKTLMTSGDSEAKYIAASVLAHLDDTTSAGYDARMTRQEQAPRDHARVMEITDAMKNAASEIVSKVQSGQFTEDQGAQAMAKAEAILNDATKYATALTTTGALSKGDPSQDIKTMEDRAKGFISHYLFPEMDVAKTLDMSTFKDLTFGRAQMATSQATEGPVDGGAVAKELLQALYNTPANITDFTAGIQSADLSVDTLNMITKEQGKRVEGYRQELEDSTASPLTQMMSDYINEPLRKLLNFFDPMSTMGDSLITLSNIIGKNTDMFVSFANVMAGALSGRGAKTVEEKAAGGFISGHGGPREDNIPAMLSSGEYVVRAHSTAKLGKKALNYINSTGTLPSFSNGGALTDAELDALFSDQPAPVSKYASERTMGKYKGLSDAEVTRLYYDKEAVSPIVATPKTAPPEVIKKLTGKQQERDLINKVMGGDRYKYLKRADGGTIGDPAWIKTMRSQINYLEGDAAPQTPEEWTKRLMEEARKAGKITPTAVPKKKSGFSKFFGDRYSEIKDIGRSAKTIGEGIAGKYTAEEFRDKTLADDEAKLRDATAGKELLDKYIEQKAGGGSIEDALRLTIGGKDEELREKAIRTILKSGRISEGGVKSSMSFDKPFFGRKPKGEHVYTNLGGSGGIRKLNQKKGQFEDYVFGKKGRDASTGLLEGDAARAEQARRDASTGIITSHTLPAGQEGPVGYQGMTMADYASKKTTRVIKPTKFKRRILSPSTTKQSVFSKATMAAPLRRGKGRYAALTDTASTLLSKYDFGTASASSAMMAINTINNSSNDNEVGKSVVWLKRWLSYANKGRFAEDLKDSDFKTKAQGRFKDEHEYETAIEKYYEEKTKENYSFLGTAGLDPTKAIRIGSSSFIQKAAGGSMFGSGGPRADSIPAMLSAGEYVINAHAANKLGTSNLDFINKKGKLPSFAAGGATEYSAGESTTIKVDYEDAVIAMKTAITEALGSFNITDAQRTMIIPDDLTVSLAEDSRAVTLSDNKVEISNVDAIATAISSSNNVGAEGIDRIGQLLEEMEGRVSSLEEAPEDTDMLNGDAIAAELETIKADLRADQNASLQEMNTTINNARSDVDNLRQKQVGLTNRLNLVATGTESQLNEMKTTIYSMRT